MQLPELKFGAMHSHFAGRMEEGGSSHDKLRPILQDYRSGIADNEPTFYLGQMREGGRWREIDREVKG